MITIIIPEKDAGQRLDKYLFKKLPSAPKNVLFKQLRNKNITLNDKKCKGSELLSDNDCIKLYLSDDTYAKFSSPQSTLMSEETVYIDAYNQYKDIEILYENEHILAVNKPSGLLTQRAKDIDVSLNDIILGLLISRDNLTSADIQMYRPSCVNRLDRNTSGIVLAAKTQLGASTLSDLIKNHRIDKYYRTFAYGEINSPMHIEAYLSKNETTNTVTITDEAPKGADASRIITELIPIKVIKNGFLNMTYTYVEVKLLTGKSHQIRATFDHIGHPLLGDPKYGKRGINDKLNSKWGISSQLLHAARIEMPKDTLKIPELSGLIINCKEPAEYGYLE